MTHMKVNMLWNWTLPLPFPFTGAVPLHTQPGPGVLGELCKLFNFK